LPAEKGPCVEGFVDFPGDLRNSQPASALNYPLLRISDPVMAAVGAASATRGRAARARSSMISGATDCLFETAISLLLPPATFVDDWES
jgi:hypothetical protein